MANSIIPKYGDPSSAPADDLVQITKADEDLPDGPCRGLLVGVAGTANLVTLADQPRANVPLVQGWNPVACRRVRPGGTASDIWAIY